MFSGNKATAKPVHVLRLCSSFIAVEIEAKDLPAIGSYLAVGA